MFRSQFARNFNKRFYSTYKSFSNNSSVFNNPYGFATKHWKGIAAFATVSTVFVGTHIERAPISNRRRFMLIGPTIERYLGDQGYRDVLEQFKSSMLPENHPEVMRVKEIMKNLIRVSPYANDDTIDWRIHVINDPKQSPNAFVLPGGKVFVFSTILPICGNNDGLATVLSHELAHQVARHTAENMSKTPLYLIAGMVLYSITGSQALNSLITNSLFKLPASREMEKEADYIGLILMSRACYNPNEAVHVWERMENFEHRAASGAMRAPEFLSTHPATSNRIENIKGWLPEAREARVTARCDERYTNQLPTFLDWNPNRFSEVF